MVPIESWQGRLGKREHRVVGSRKGSDLVDLRYEPPYRFETPESGKPWRVGVARRVPIICCST